MFGKGRDTSQDIWDYKSSMYKLIEDRNKLELTMKNVEDPDLFMAYEEKLNYLCSMINYFCKKAKDGEVN